MSSHRYSTALSDLILAATSGFCLVAKYHDCFKNTYHFAYGTFGSICTNSIVGIWRWGNPHYGGNIDKTFKTTLYLQQLIALPCLTSQIWLCCGYWKELAYLHASISLVPLLLYLMDKSRSKLLDLIICANSISLGIVSLLNRRYYGIAASISYVLNHFIIREGMFDLDIPILDLYNYGLSFFAYFAYRTV